MAPRRTAAAKAYLRKQNERYGLTLECVPRSEWGDQRGQPDLVSVWRSRNFLVQVYAPSRGATRLSINRTSLQRTAKRWDDSISWDDLQRLKRECGFGDREAVEVYPPDDAVVNDANMRHLWVLPERMPFSWKR